MTTRDSNLSGAIADQIRDLVTRGVFMPGFQLRQIDLAERFGASRVPVREALKQLTAEGIVAHDPNRGFFVAHLSSDEARQLYRMRHLLETEVLSTVEWPDKKRLAQLTAHVTKLSELMKAGKRAEWAIRHRDFYRRVYELSPHKVLAQEVLRLLRMTDRYRSLGPRSIAIETDGVSSELRVLSALTARDRERLVREFDEDRTRIEAAMVDNLVARGL